LYAVPLAPWAPSVPLLITRRRGQGQPPLRESKPDEPSRVESGRTATKQLDAPSVLDLVGGSTRGPRAVPHLQPL